MKQGAPLERRDNEEWTTLMFSVNLGMGEVVSLLLDSGQGGCDPILVSLDGQRAADIGLVAVPCRNLLTDYVGRGTAGQGEGGGEEEFT